MSSITLTSKDKNRFWSKINTGDPNDCWTWTAATENGYGRVGIQGRLFLAHRLAWILEFGDLSDDLDVLHKCDNRSCCNPNHLFLGTQLDNIKDMVSKNRHIRGETVPNSKLSANQVNEIRELLKNGIKATEIADMFNINTGTVSKIKKGRLWAWLK